MRHLFYKGNEEKMKIATKLNKKIIYLESSYRELFSLLFILCLLLFFSSLKSPLIFIRLKVSLTLKQGDNSFQFFWTYNIYIEFQDTILCLHVWYSSPVLRLGFKSFKCGSNLKTMKSFERKDLLKNCSYSFRKNLKFKDLRSK